MTKTQIPISSIHWNPCWRIIPSRWPSINLFERVANPADWELLIDLESLTNDRIRNETGMIALVSTEDRVSGPGASYIMAPFTHINTDGTRFSDGTYGVFYAGLEFETAIDETIYHRTRFLAFTREPSTDLQMTALEIVIQGDLNDIRKRFPKAHNPDDYTHSRSIGAHLRKSNSFGIVYNSVRHSGGECAAIFRPSVIKSCRQAKHLIYHWDESVITVWEQVR